jgi:hypothetical protein
MRPKDYFFGLKGNQSKIGNFYDKDNQAEPILTFRRI